MSKREVVVAGEIIELDDQDTKFNDRTLNPFFERISGRIDYIGQCHADAQRESLKKEQEVEQAYIGRYKAYKEDGKSDKTAELYAKGDPIVVAKKSEHIDARHAKDTLWAHLQALNAAREDAHNRGHMIRKELDKLGSEIYHTENTANHFQDALNDVVKEAGEYK